MTAADRCCPELVARMWPDRGTAFDSGFKPLPGPWSPVVVCHDWTLRVDHLRGGNRCSSLNVRAQPSLWLQHCVRMQAAWPPPHMIERGQHYDFADDRCETLGVQMAIVRSVDWVLRCPPSTASETLEAAMSRAGFKDVRREDNSIHGSQKAAVMKNRWASEVDAAVQAHPSGAQVAVRVSMPAGTKHYAVMDSISDEMPDELFDDRGAEAAVQRLGRSGRMFGGSEIRHLRYQVRPDETVLEVGVGSIDGKMGLVAITTQRLFFFQKGLAAESLQEFALPTIQALSTSKKLGGEKLEVSYSGMRAEIKQLGHGQGDVIVRAFRYAREQAATAVPSPAPAAPVADPAEQLTKLASLKEAGIITQDEFDTKKTEILSRM